jgi:hypothetical protein
MSEYLNMTEIAWNRVVLAKMGYEMTDDQWAGLTTLLSDTAQDWFNENEIGDE